MDRQGVITAFDQQVRRQSAHTGPDATVDRAARVHRHLLPDGGWSGVTWSDLDEGNADGVIAGEVRRFAEHGAPWEWKYYSYDRPLDLPDRLRAFGFAPEPQETLLVAEIAELDLDVRPPAGIDLVDVVDAPGVDLLTGVHDTVFGGDHSRLAQEVLSCLADQPATMTAVLAMEGRTAIAGGRVEFHPGTDFSSLWGGGTLPAWRRQGLFRALVAYRAGLAAARGFRYLQVDASEDSRPVLERLGFVVLATTTPYIHPGRPIAG